MAAIKCAECGGTVSTTAKTCPHCGANSKVFRRSSTGVGGILLRGFAIFMVIGILGNLISKDDAPNTTRSASNNSVSSSSHTNQSPSDKAVDREIAPTVICKAAISLMFGQPVGSISASQSGQVVELVYTRSVDSSDWKYRCKLRGNEIIWAGFIDGDWGRWREHATDAEVTYRVNANKLTVSEKYPSMNESTKTFDLNSI